MTKAEQTLAYLTAEHCISPTGHAPGSDRDTIFRRCGKGELMDIVESDAEGYPQVSESWEAIRFDDGSLLICTYVRGRRETDFWEAISDLKDFEIWHRYAA